MDGLPSESRLRWLCRRGMLELDAWLARFLDLSFGNLPPDQQLAFARLLDQDDMTLFDWFTGERTPPEAFRDVVDMIKTTRYPKT